MNGDGQTTHYIQAHALRRFHQAGAFAERAIAVNGALQRIQEAARLGFKRALVPIGSDIKVAGIEIMEVGRIEAAISRVKIG